tara:strand:+ start:3215 stop:4108 length:894 start_codon:yes stop_codon:yes gene_type:complete
MSKTDTSSIFVWCLAILGTHYLVRVIIPDILNDITKKEKFSNTTFSTQTKRSYSSQLMKRPATQDAVYLINLEKRTDRLEHFEKAYNNCDIVADFKRISAVDGSKIVLEEENLLTDKARTEIYDYLDKGYREKHYQLTKGGIGCYLSHINVWEQILKDDVEIALIFEDDTTIPKDIQSKLDAKMKTAPPDWDIMLLGVMCHTCKELETRKGFHKVSRFWLTHAYLIKKTAVEKIFKSGTLFPISQQIDSYLSEMSNKVNIYAIEPGLCSQNTGFNTDIQAPVKYNKYIDSLERQPIS